MKSPPSLIRATSVAAGTLATGAMDLAAMPKGGDIAPLVAGKDQNNKLWRMADALGSEAVLVYFYPKDDTPGCTKHAGGWRDRLSELNRDAVGIVSLSLNTVRTHRAFAEKHRLNLKLIADPEGHYADACGVRTAPGQSRARRVSFLVNRVGKIVAISDSPDADTHLVEMQAAVTKLGGNQPQSAPRLKTNFP